MAKDKSFQQEVPRSRIQITYVKDTGDAKEKTELPMRLLLMGDYTLKEDETPLEERKKININKDNFESVLKEQKLSLKVNVPNKMAEAEGEEMSVDLKFDKMKSFEPEAIAQQIPELNTLLQLRELLKDLKARVVTNKDFRKTLERLLKDKDSLDSILGELDKIAPLAELAGEKKSEG